MGYDYYCTECGKTNNAETVLFNMDPLLTQSKTKDLNLIHLRLTEKELLTMINSGTKNEDGGYECILSFSDFVELLSGKNSMNMPELQELTLDDVESFIKVSHAGESNDNNIFGSNLFNIEDEEDESIFDKEVDNYAAAIQKLLKTSKINADTAFDKSYLKEDFQLIYNLFMTDDQNYHFTLKKYTIFDDKSNELIDGYWINQNCIDGARVCCKCKKTLFKKAGTAEHRVISFIGETSSGKTSTILSLTHYALYGLCPMQNSKDNLVWKQNGVVNETRKFQDVSPELLTRDNDSLVQDLEWFKYGVAPAKTDANNRADAYHSTLLVTNGNDGRKMIVSLMDLPGELFNKNGIKGEVDLDRINNTFSAALSSSAFVICFDTTNGIEIADIVNLLGNASIMQRLRCTHTGDEDFVPSMVLFSKADEASAELLESEGGKTLLYMLRGEDDALRYDNVYKHVKQNFKTDNMLSNSYYSIMRCGAFGCPVPTSVDVLQSSQSGRDIFGNGEVEQRTIDKEAYVNAYNTSSYREKHNTPEARMPKPNQMDLLMQWILQLTGCLPMNQKYETKIYKGKTLNNYYITRIQYRKVNPGYDLKKKTTDSAGDHDIMEAMARQVLFSNPGCWDRLLVESLSVPDPRGLIARFIPKSSIDGHKENIRLRMSKNHKSNV